MLQTRTSCASFDLLFELLCMGNQWHISLSMRVCALVSFSFVIRMKGCEHLQFSCQCKWSSSRTSESVAQVRSQSIQILFFVHWKHVEKAMPERLRPVAEQILCHL